MMETETPFVSVVTPFYNTDAYLKECIESVLSQSFKHFEYVLVNNQSTDRSADIARSFAASDSRIRVVDTDRFLSQSQNYNFALKQISADSRYCKVVQADDWLFPECLARMIGVAESDTSIGVVAGYRLQGKYISNDGLEYSTAAIPGRAANRLNLLMDGRQLYGSPTTVMMRSEIVRGRTPFYPDGAIFEDSDAIFEVLRDCNLGFAFEVCTYERVDNEGISSSVERHDPAWFLSKYLRVRKYGPEFLSEQEYTTRINDIERAYMRFLARNLFRRRGKDFWRYHRIGLDSIGHKLTLGSLTPYIAMEIADLLFNPKATVGATWRWVRKRLQ